jgi:hypothetical protein
MSTVALLVAIVGLKSLLPHITRNPLNNQIFISVFHLFFYIVNSCNQKDHFYTLYVLYTLYIFYTLYILYVLFRAGRLGDRGSIPGRGDRIFPLVSASRPSLGLTQHLVQWIPGRFFAGAKSRPGRDADHSPPCSAKVENM